MFSGSPHCRRYSSTFCWQITSVGAAPGLDPALQDGAPHAVEMLLVVELVRRGRRPQHLPDPHVLRHRHLDVGDHLDLRVIDLQQRQRRQRRVEQQRRHLELLA